MIAGDVDESGSARAGRVLAWPAFRKELANPHAALLARELIKLGVDVVDWTPFRALMWSSDLWHLHHPESVLHRRSSVASIFETLVFLGLLRLARLRGTRIVWTVHDLGSNDKLHPRLEAWFLRLFVPQVDAIICLTESSRSMTLERFPCLANRPNVVVPHGHYRGVYPDTETRETARQRLALPADATVLLHFGLMRPYKNVPHLIRTFRATPVRGNILLVVGRVFDAVIEREIREAADGASNVRLDLRWVPNEEVQTFFAASDLVVLPYRRILNSGAVMLALTFARPVLAPDLGSMREHQETFGADWILLYTGTLTTSGLTAASEWASRTPRQAVDFEGLEWRPLALRTRSVYHELSRCSPRRTRHGWRRGIDGAA